jgi:hypothetical protein
LLPRIDLLGMIRKTIKPAIIRKQPNLRHWKRALVDEPAFIVANGCSANDIDPALIRDRFTIGINRAFMLFDPVVLFWQDVSLWQSEKVAVLKSSAIQVCRDIADPQHRFYNFRLRTSDGFRMTESPHMLYGSGATGPLAVEFACAMGCNPIVLIGFDCKYRNAKTDFYGVNPFHRDHTLINCTKGLKWIHKQREQHNFINCSDNDVFTDSRSLHSVLAGLPPAKGRSHYISHLRSLTPDVY